jgi:hypothetical protein
MVVTSTLDELPFGGPSASPEASETARPLPRTSWHDVRWLEGVGRMWRRQALVSGLPGGIIESGCSLRGLLGHLGCSLVFRLRCR